MKWIYTIFCFLLSTTLYAEEVRLANGEWSPFLSKKSPHYGYASHIVTEAFKEVGIEVKYEFVPWARAEEEVKKGRIDGSVVWSITQKREKFAYFSDPVIVQNEVLFHLKKRPVLFNTMEDLHGLRAVLVRGSKLGTLKKLIETKKISLDRASDVKAGFQMLLLGRVDVFPLIDSVGYHLIRTQFQEGRGQITHAPKAIDRIEYRLMLSKDVTKNAQMLKQFNRGLKLLHDRGKYQRMEKDFYAGKYD